MASGTLTAAQWIAQEIVANEMYWSDGLPLSARNEIARELVDNPDLGWPSIEDAQRYLNDWAWR